MKKIYKLILMSLAWMSFSTGASASTFCKPSVLIAAASGYASDVQSRLQATGMFSSVQLFDAASGTPTLAYLQTFDAVMVFTDNGCSDPTTFGNNLAAYIDGGGGVVSTVFDDASIPIGGNFNTNTYRVLLPASQTQGTMRTLGTVLLPSHPMMAGVVTFSAGSSSYISTSTSLAPGAYTIANYDDGSPLLTANENVSTMMARRADLNFYPPSSNIRSDFWDVNTDGDKIMVNALYWVCKSSLDPVTGTICVTGPPITLTGYPMGGTYSGNGVTGNSFDPTVAGAGTHTIYYVHTNVSGCLDTASITIVVNLCTGVIDTKNEISLNVSPNPSSGMFNVNIAGEGLDHININVLDVEGRVVYNVDQSASGNAFNKVLSLNGLANGMYSLQVVSNLGVATKKIVIQK